MSSLPPSVLLTDVDRFVDALYLPAVDQLALPLLSTDIHRYAVDLNRVPEDVDQDAVQGARFPSGTHPKGFHWVKTTRGEALMTQPMTEALHQEWVARYHDVFHQEIAAQLEDFRKRLSATAVFHLDCHSMPSQGTSAHADAGERRPDVVVSDFNGRSALPAFKDAVIAGFQAQGLNVSYNWPYQGGRITQRYGRPESGHHTIQIELNRALYLDEKTKEKGPGFASLQLKLEKVLEVLCAWIEAQVSAGSSIRG